jgi:glycosidase
VLYLIMPDRFANGETANDDPAEAKGYYDRTKARGFHGGDLKGVEEHLPYIKDLGATAVWLTPFWKNANDYHGYGVTDFYAVDPHFGTLDEYKKLVAAAHAQGIKFVFDYVVNHTGPGHVWTKHPPLATWLHGTPQKHPPFDYHFEYLVDPHAPKREWEDITEGWFADTLPDLNVDDPHVAKYLLDNAVWWMETGGVDAFRLDTFPYSSRSFWSYWHKELFRIYPTTNTVGEVWNFDPTLTSFFEGGQKRWDGIDDRLPTMFDFPLYHTVREVLSADKPADDLPKILRYDALYLRPYGLVTFIGNHDTKRILSEQGMTPQKLKAAFGLLMTLRGIPEIYTGDEVAMTGGDDPENRHDFPGGWPGDKQNAFQKSSRTPEQEEMHHYVKSLVALRREYPALRDGRQWTIGTGTNYYAYLREDGSERLLMVFSKKGGSVEIPLADTPLASARSLEPLMGAPAATVVAGTIKTTTQDFSVAIYRVR